MMLRCRGNASTENVTAETEPLSWSSALLGVDSDIFFSHKESRYRATTAASSSCFLSLSKSLLSVAMKWLMFITLYINTNQWNCVVVQG